MAIYLQLLVVVVIRAVPFETSWRLKDELQVFSKEFRTVTTAVDRYLAIEARVYVNRSIAPPLPLLLPVETPSSAFILL